MSKCSTCGRENPIEEANFCYYCGAPLGSRRPGFLPADEAEELERLEQSGQIPQDGGYRPGEPKAVAADDEQPAISRWKVLGLLCLLMIPVYGWLFLIGWMVMNLLNPKASLQRKEVIKGVLMFVVLFAVLLFAATAYINAHPELMKEYEEMYNQMFGGSAGCILGR